MKRWLIRRDGIRQRYNIKGSIQKRGYRPTGKKSRTGAKIWTKAPEEVYRATATINYAIHHRYYSIRLQRWFKSEAEARAAEDDMIKEVRQMFKDRLGYDLDLFGPTGLGTSAPFQIGWGVQKVPGPLRIAEYAHEFLGQSKLRKPSGRRLL